MPHSAENTACKGTPLEPPRLPMPTRSASFGLTSRLLGTGFGTRFIFFSVLPFSFQQSFWMRGTLYYPLGALSSSVFGSFLSVQSPSQLMHGTERRIGRVRGIVIFYLSVYLKNPLQRLILTSPKLLLSVRPPQGWFGCRKAVATAACG